MIQTYTSGFEIETDLQDLAPGQHRLGAIDLAAFNQDKSSEAGKDFNRFLANLHGTSDPNLVPMRVALQDRIHNPERFWSHEGGMRQASAAPERIKLIDVLRTIGSGPVLMSGADDTVRAFIEQGGPIAMRFQAHGTQNGVIVAARLRSPGGATFQQYLNPYSTSAHGFLLALWQFPRLMWVARLGEKTSVMSFAHFEMSFGCAQVLTEVSRKPRKKEYDFWKEVDSLRSESHET